MHLQTLYNVNSRNPTVRLPNPVEPSGFISTPADLYCFMKTFMFGYTDASSYCALHRDNPRNRCVTVLFHLDIECEIHPPPASEVSGVNAEAKRVSTHRAAINRRVLTEILQTTVRLNIRNDVDANNTGRITGPRLHTGSHYILTQYWLTEILEYLCDSCCFGHSHRTDAASTGRQVSQQHESIALARSYLTHWASTDTVVTVATAATTTTTTPSSLRATYPLLVNMLESNHSVDGET